MSIEMEEEIKSWTAKRKSVLVVEIIQGKKSVAEAAIFVSVKHAQILTPEWLCAYKNYG